MIEVIITLVIVAAAAYILIKNLKGKKSGGCNCGSCSSKCPIYKDKKKDS